MFYAKDLEKFVVDTTLQRAWVASYRDYLRKNEPILLDSEFTRAREHADKIVESLKKCR